MRSPLMRIPEKLFILGLGRGKVCKSCSFVVVSKFLLGTGEMVFFLEDGADTDKRRTSVNIKNTH